MAAHRRPRSARELVAFSAALPGPHRSRAKRHRPGSGWRVRFRAAGSGRVVAAPETIERAAADLDQDRPARHERLVRLLMIAALGPFARDSEAALDRDSLSYLRVTPPGRLTRVTRGVMRGRLASARRRGFSWSLCWLSR